MKQLSATWITDDYIDFELKKYKLLDYLTFVKEQFDEKKLYPHLADLINHLSNLESLREKKLMIRNNFPKKLSHIDILQFNMEYKALVEQSDHMEELDKVLDYAIPQINKHIQMGAELYDKVESQMKMLSVGLIATYDKMGYFIIDSTKLDLYKYEVGELVLDEAHRAVKVEYIKNYEKMMENTYERIRLEILKDINNILDNPNPPMYIFKTSSTFPVDETILPIAKRMILLRNVTF